MKEIQCEAQVHSDQCNGVATEIDHFTPQSLGKRVLRWDHFELNHPMNLIPMNHFCHVIKDRSTPSKLAQAIAQSKGKFIGFGEHK